MPAKRYDHPTFITRREFSGRSAVTSAGTNVPMGVYAKARLVAAHAVVAVVGTNNSMIEEVRIGTDSVGVFALGTQAVGYTTSIGSEDSPLGTVSQYGVVNTVKTGSAGGQADIIYEYEVLPDAVLS